MILKPEEYILNTLMGDVSMSNRNDNTDEPFRIFKKRKNLFFRWNSRLWSDEDIEMLTGISEYSEK